MNKQFLNCCLLLPQDALVRETHSFFPNIISYWNHLLFGDLILLRRLSINNIALLGEDLRGLPLAKTPSDTYGVTMEEIVTLRERVDGLIVSYCEKLTDAMCNEIVCYKTTEGDGVQQEVSLLIQHMFNHQAHHRGQLSCVLSQFGVDYGCTDLPVLVSNI